MDMMKMMFSEEERNKMFQQFQTFLKSAIAEVLTDHGMPNLLSLADDTDGLCFLKARSRHERTFTLVEHDATAPQCIRDWAALNYKNAPVKANKACQIASEWEDSQVTKRIAKDKIWQKNNETDFTPKPSTENSASAQSVEEKNQPTDNVKDS